MVYIQLYVYNNLAISLYDVTLKDCTSQRDTKEIIIKIFVFTHIKSEPEYRNAVALEVTHNE